MDWGGAYFLLAAAAVVEWRDLGNAQTPDRVPHTNSLDVTLDRHILEIVGVGHRLPLARGELKLHPKSVTRQGEGIGVSNLCQDVLVRLSHLPEMLGILGHVFIRPLLPRAELRLQLGVGPELPRLFRLVLGTQAMFLARRLAPETLNMFEREADEMLLLVEGLLIPLLPRLVVMEDVGELVQAGAVEESEGADHGGDGPSRECTAGEANDDNLIARVVVVADEAIALYNILGNANAEGPAEGVGDLGRLGSRARMVVDNLRHSRAAFVGHGARKAADISWGARAKVVTAKASVSRHRPRMWPYR